MKHLMTVSMLAILLAACSSTNTTDIEGQTEGNSTEQSTVEENEISKAEDEAHTNEETNIENQHEEQTNQADPFPETEVLAQYIDLDQLEQQIVEDNPGKRVMLLVSPEGEKEYKSVFIKETIRLKIIPIGPGAPLYNDTI
ncbi:putative periplasmic lipoprotein [Gracilibacillus timonensis]|uniref:hypothetical protein n=1 Tax=Gracilibacillus timonensis TaxID=1816696 RepID=UPI000826FECE|nr:hypothetical protein [Gracilibacillus timonensis]